MTSIFNIANKVITVSGGEHFYRGGLQIAIQEIDHENHKMKILFEDGKKSE